ncbi:hypothetical protein DMC30DRAFT_145228 [Rhodotorula diobovata]|uniref:DUF7727 domain-containing protein n=1 Tax=Rhodotorula diobovata TaxID=5288 RepID=A0A5C5G0L8_9BASI|nr:hypothetical protein DMC30DRAFT_145228 [Rhodotorula diobovata]
MGVLIWHDWARLLALTSACYVGWATLWAFFYRKFFWDFVGASLGPEGLVPPPSAHFFVVVIVDFPVLQIINLVNALVTLALEWPFPPLKRLKLHRSLLLRVFLYTWCTFVASLVYQTAFPALFYLVTLFAYATALAKGEIMGRDAQSSAAATGKV